MGASGRTPPPGIPRMSCCNLSIVDLIFVNNQLNEKKFLCVSRKFFFLIAAKVSIFLVLVSYFLIKLILCAQENVFMDRCKGCELCHTLG
mmetsp:Transcript_36143/g.84485  ORF Transcript_36143/g.84485 Transcript_36143/m.84485 type:complete len:90 (-) Transcript_36143:102-371(-)